MGKRTLVLEDDTHVREFAVAVLRAEKHDVLTATNVADARKIVDAQPAAENLFLVVDIVLGDESGLKFAQQLIKDRENCRVLLISGFTDDVVLTDPDDVARIAFLPKPFTRVDLTSALGRLGV